MGFGCSCLSRHWILSCESNLSIYSCSYSLVLLISVESIVMSFHSWCWNLSSFFGQSVQRFIHLVDLLKEAVWGFIGFVCVYSVSLLYLIDFCLSTLTVSLLLTLGLICCYVGFWKLTFILAIIHLPPSFSILGM